MFSIIFTPVPICFLLIINLIKAIIKLAKVNIAIITLIGLKLAFTTSGYLKFPYSDLKYICPIATLIKSL